MTTVGITGHVGLTVSTRSAVAVEITRILDGLQSPVAGYTSLAPGADQVFAWSVAAVGGDIVFVAPCAQIASTIPDDNRKYFNAARALAVETVDLPHESPGEQAYFDAGAHIADTVDLLIAVWDGRPAGGLGGTADIVARRQASGRDLVIVWPAGSARD